MNSTGPRRPAARTDFEIAIICALRIEADAVKALFDHHWDDAGPPYDKTARDPNAYSTGAIGRHNVVLAHMPSMGKASAAAVAAHCHSSFPNLRLALIVGVCGVVPFYPSDNETVEIVLGDVIVSEGVVQYDFGQRLPEEFVPKETLRDTLGRPNSEIRALLTKLQGLRDRKMLQGNMAGYMDVAVTYPGATQDKLFEATYRHVGDGMSCQECACDGKLVSRARLEPGGGQPAVHFGLIASGDTVMKSAKDRDAIAELAGVIGFEMEGAAVWDILPCVVIKGACDYADSHKNKVWQRYAAATAAACMKAFLDRWVPSTTEPLPLTEQLARSWFLVPFPENKSFIGRESTLEKLQQQHLGPSSHPRIALFGLGGVGKTQIALAYTYLLQRTKPEISVFWVYASNAERFRRAYASIAEECQIPGYDDPKVDVLLLVKSWLEKKDRGRWLMVIDNADDMQLFFGPSADSSGGSASTESRHVGKLEQYIPECSHGSLLITTRNKQAGLRLAKGHPPIVVPEMDDTESEKLLRAKVKENPTSDELSTLSSRLERLPLTLVQAAAFIEANSITVSEYLRLLDKSNQSLVDLLSEEFETDGRDSETPRAVAETWILSFEQIQRQNPFAGDLLSLMSLFDRQAIPSEFLSRYSEQQGQEAGGGLQLTKALGVLKAFSFMVEEKDRSLDMHRLVQLVTRRWLTKKGKMRHFAGQALLAVSHCYPYGKYENWALCSAYLAHAYAVLGSEGTGSRDEKAAKASLLHCVAKLFNSRGQWKDAERFQLEAVELREAALGSEHPSTLISMASLASTYHSQGRWEEAEKICIQVMEIHKTKLGATHRDTLTSMGNLASIYTQQSRWEEAEKLFVQVIETRKTKLGADHLSTITSMGNLALTYRYQGRWGEAEKLGVQVMETRKTKLGADHPSTLTSMCNLASTYRYQGRWEEAEELEVQVIETRKTKLGADHPDTLTSMDNLASTYREQGRWEEAEKLEVQAVEAFKTKLGTNHPDTLTSMNNLAHTWERQGRHTDALALMEDCARARQRVLGANHPYTLGSLAAVAKWRS